jgi:hypothetical protein
MPVIVLLIGDAKAQQVPLANAPITKLSQLRPLQPFKTKPPQPYVRPKGEGDAYVPPPLKTNIGKTPSSLNLSGNDYIRSPQPDPGAYSPQIEARSLRMFTSSSQEQERQQWMAEQEQRAIANEINRTKPLQYPMNGR